MKKTILCLSLSVLMSLILARGPALSMPYEEIFDWVAHELKIDNKYPMPQIRVVSKEELQRLLRKDVEKYYQRWVEEYGETEAKEALDLYVKEVIGLFLPKTKVIYVGDFMEPCKFNSIVAHEITHYLQDMEDQPSAGFVDVHFLREMQASQIENRFVETHCADSNPSSR